MLRVVAGLMLFSLVLPYARSPLCEAGRHAHEHQVLQAAVSALQHTGESGADCHALMGCNVVVQVAVVAAREPTRATPPARTGDDAPRIRRADATHPPLAPPPKSI